ncbi:hypothetical protein [Enterococcus ratti]|uniref:hypothetical protein n=1 Tax=Enterococcus ratti TaxID=150033 RepID=UPI0009004E80|nr:hypothetical protein [Enterococcus ratti]
MNTCNLPLSFGELTVIICPKTKQVVLLNTLKTQALSILQKRFIIVQKNWPLFPYLKVKDQVLLNLSEDKKARLTYQKELKIDPVLLNKRSDHLSLFDKIKLQLLHALLAKKDEIIIEDLFEELSISETQELLDLLAYLVKNEQRAILLLSHDEAIAHSPYVNKLYDER